MTKINQIWEELENDKSFSEGLLLRRYSGAVLPDVYVAMQHPEKLFCICISISDLIEVNISSFSNLQEIQVDFYPSPNQAGKNALVFKLINFQHKDIFNVLCEDLIASISTETNERKLVKEILNRFEKWKSLFSKIGLQGLTPEEQRGLFGELFFMREFFNSKGNTTYIVNSWVGPENAVIDFQSNNWGVEVKTTSGNNHQKVNISNERQLDTKNYEHLFLYHISLDQRQNSGESLNDIVLSLKDLLSKDELVLNKFIHKLFEAGYFDVHIPLYKECGYSIRQNTFYKVENDFPRIEEKDVQNGLGDIRYSIILSYCNNFIVNYEFVFNLLNVE